MLELYFVVTNIRLRHLTAFIEIARLKSVSAAALSLAVSQPAVSKTLRELEETLGVKLTERVGKGIGLTAYGEIFLGYATSSVTSLNQGVDSVIRSARRGGSTLSIGALPTVATRLLPAAIKRFALEAPGVTIRVETGNNESLFEQVRIGKLDVVVGRLAKPEQMKRLSFEYLYQESIVLAVRPQHPLLKRKTRPLSLKDLNAYNVLMPPSGSIIRPDVEKMYLLAGTPLPSSRLETVSMAFARPYLIDTDSVWIISRGVVTNELEAGHLCELPIDTSKIVGPLGVTLPSDTPASLPTQLFMKVLREIVSNWKL